MTKDTRKIVGVTCLAFTLIHAVLLGLVLLLPGEGRMLVFYFEYPLFWLDRLMFPTPDGEVSPLVGYAYVWIGGTVFYGLVVGVPFGFAIVGIRRLLKWLNDDRWIRE